jgi:hypothetical protein
MRVSIKKIVVAAIAALGMATAMASMPTPAEAQWHGGGGFHGGGFHGGGWGGGWHGGGWRGGVGGGGWDPGWAIAAATVPVGVAIASQPAYDGGPGCWARRRVWTANGHDLGRRLVNICM